LIGHGKLSNRAKDACRVVVEQITHPLSLIVQSLSGVSLQAKVPLPKMLCLGKGHL
jgi:hypothetical protein